MKLVVFVFLLTLFAVALPAQVKSPRPAAKKTPFAKSLQVIVVTTTTASSVQGKAQRYERRTVSSKWKKVGGDLPVVVGRNGLAWDEGAAAEGETVLKREGDGRSPAGLFPLTFAFGRPDKPGQIKLSYSKLGEYSECVDDVGSTHYNKLVDRLKVGIFDWNSSEKMLEVGPEYDLGVFVAYNSFPVKRGNGSCIFLHIWKDAATGTAGCTAMPREELLEILEWADPAKHPYLVQMTEDAYRKYQKAWNLPKM